MRVLPIIFLFIGLTLSHPLDSDDDQTPTDILLDSSSVITSSDQTGPVLHENRTPNSRFPTDLLVSRASSRLIAHLARKWSALGLSRRMSVGRYLARNVHRLRYMSRAQKRHTIRRFLRAVRRYRHRRRHSRRRGGLGDRKMRYIGSRNVGHRRSKIRSGFPRRRSRVKVAKVGGYKLSHVGSGFVSASCRAAGEVWAVSTRNYGLYRYGITREMVPSGHVEGGAVQVATTCGGQAYALSRYGKVYSHYGGDRWVALPGSRFPFVRIAAGRDGYVLGLTKRGDLYRLHKRSWGKVSRSSRHFRDVALSCSGVIAAVDSHGKVSLRDEKGSWRDLPALPKSSSLGRPESITISGAIARVLVTHRSGVVSEFGPNGWETVPVARLNDVSLSSSGTLCGTYGQHLYVAWTGGRAPRAKVVDESSLTPEPADPSDTLAKDPFSGKDHKPYLSKRNPFAPATPTRADEPGANVRDNLPLSVTDFRKLAPAPPKGFEPFSYDTDLKKNGPVQDPLPGPKAEFQSSIGKASVEANKPAKKGTGIYEKIHYNSKRASPLP